MTHVQQLLARNVKRARKRLGLSQAALADRCDCSASFVSEVERARKYPSAEALERIAGALRLRPYQLLLDEDEWEVRDRLDTVADMYRDLKSRIDSVLDEALRRHMK
jgi:transcriptional regulator with XRE-family HTH domain